MHTDLDILDFEGRFLADLLDMLGPRLASLDSYIDRDHLEECDLFDPIEHIAGVGVVAAQRYVASVCNSFSVEKGEALLVGPQRKGVSVASAINAAANYWKHIEDGEGAIRTATREVLAKIGVSADARYGATNVLYECGYKNFDGLMSDLYKWRDAVIEKAKEKLA